MAIQLGTHCIDSPVFSAPMAGVSDKPYRKLCRKYGAGLAVSEMVTSKLELRHTTKSRFRMDLQDELAPVSVQIVGTEPQKLAAAAQFNVGNGAQIIDINMGCPAKKVCNKAAGSALLGDEPLVADILHAVVAAVDVPVTLKIRTGPHPNSRNAERIAKIAENAGIQLLTVHGRTRACRFVGEVEYDTIAKVKQAVSIPVVANGDITTAEQAAEVMAQTGVDAIMVGRAAQGQPWLLKQMVQKLNGEPVTSLPSLSSRATEITQHVKEIHDFYGHRLGVKLARKHIKWYLQHWPIKIDQELRLGISTTEDCEQQLDSIHYFLEQSQLDMAA